MGPGQVQVPKLQVRARSGQIFIFKAGYRVDESSENDQPEHFFCIFVNQYFEKKFQLKFFSNARKKF